MKHIEFRWFVVCDKKGIKSKPILQFRKDTDWCWMYVPCVEKKIEEVGDGDGLL